MSDNKIDRLAALGSQTEEQLAFAQEVGRADLILTALAVAIHALSKVPVERGGSDLRAMKLLFHELAGVEWESWQDRAKYLVDGDSRD